MADIPSFCLRSKLQLVCAVEEWHTFSCGDGRRGQYLVYSRLGMTLSSYLAKLNASFLESLYRKSACSGPLLNHVVPTSGAGGTVICHVCVLNILPDAPCRSPQPGGYLTCNFLPPYLGLKGT